MSVLVLDASSISSWQSCRRRGILDRDWRPHKWRGKALADGTLRQAILALSGGMDAAATAGEATARFLQTAANPGLDASGDTYSLAKEWCALLDTVVRSVARAGVPKGLVEHPPVRLNSSVEWQPLAHVSGQSLHRWVTLDRWDESALMRELHSWWVIGDIATTKLPLTLHVIEIGQVRSGRRASPWTRAWRHPAMSSLPLRFKRKDGRDFQGWKPTYLSDERVSVESWVEQLWKEGAAQEVMHTIEVKVPTEHQCSRVLSDILVESLAMQEASGDHWTMQPMSRNACDEWVPCPFQTVCYGDVVDVASLGFRPRQPSPLVRPRSCSGPSQSLSGIHPATPPQPR